MKTQDLPVAVATVHRAMTAALIARLAERGFDDLTPAYAAILPLIEPQGMRQTVLAQLAGMTKQAIGQLIQELAARDYVELVADQDDRRARRVRFTARGHALRQAGFAVKEELWTAAETAIGESAAARLACDLQTVALMLDAGVAPKD